MPYSIVEAFAAGTPVVGTRIGGIPELVSEGQTGFVCEPEDVDSMADALLRGVDTFSSPEAYKAMQANCRSYVKDRCSREKFMTKLLDLYKESLNG